MARKVRTARTRMGMVTALRALIVEDSDDDTMLLLSELRGGGFEPSWERVQTAAGLSAALDRQTWDIVIADFTMPGFSGIGALRLLRDRDLDLPFIFVSGDRKSTRLNSSHGYI